MPVSQLPKLWRSYLYQASRKERKKEKEKLQGFILLSGTPIDTERSEGMFVLFMLGL